MKLKYIAPRTSVTKAQLQHIIAESVGFKEGTIDKPEDAWTREEEGSAWGEVEW